MFNSSILDVAVGVAFIFLLVSTVCSAAREGIEAFLKTRASYLEYAIRELLNDRAGTGLAKDLFEHPLISGLYQGDYTSLSRDKGARGSERPRWWHRGRTLPSYIPARSFALALLDLAARGPAQQPVAADRSEVTFASLRESVSKLEDPKVRRALLVALDTAGNDVDRVRKNLEAWYDGAMDRVSGWYKRSTQTIILLLAVAAVSSLNLNAITIADHLYRDQSLRTAVLDSAKASQRELSYEQASSKFEELKLPVGWSGGWGAPRTRGERLKLENAKRPPTQQLKAPSLSLWNDVFGPALGLMVTALAAMLGAPFWFDVLNKVMVIRATVKPHEKSPEEGSEDRQLTARYAPPTVTFAAPVPANDIAAKS